jgi:integrase
MKGHVRERPEGSGNWYAVLEMRDAVTGQRKRKWHSLDAKGRRQAETECAGLISAMQNGTALNPVRATLREFLIHWLKYIETQVSPRTRQNYHELISFWIMPKLGHVPLAKLRPEQITLTYSDALTHGRKNGTGLAPRSVRAMHRVLSQALKQAVTWNLVAKNPAALCKPPRVERKEMRVLDLAATAALAAFAEGGPLHMPILFFTLCGLRRGEVAAIRWNRLDLHAGRLAVTTSIEQTTRGVREKPPKSGRARTVTLPALLVEELHRHRVKQAEDLLRLGIRQTDETHVCLHEGATPWTPRKLTFATIRLIRASGLPRVRLHDLRHGHATHLLEANAHPKVVQERLGHASIQVTLDTYSHVLPSMQEGAAHIIDVAMRAMLKNR